MALLERNRDPSPRDLRTFGILLPVFLGLAGALSWWRGHVPAAVALWIVGGTGGLLFAVLPPLRWPLYAGWTAVTFPIGWLVSQLLLGVIFYGVLTPTGWILRLLGKDPMQRRRDPRATSHWRKLDLGRDPTRYFRQS